MVGQGKGSGIRVEARYAHLWTMRQGRGVRIDTYTDRNEALEALRATHAG
jgi:ketosteroid isomerase-like protein